MARYERPDYRIDPRDYGLPANIISRVEVPAFTLLAIMEDEDAATRFDELVESLRGKQKRDWFVQHAYHCLPLTIANQVGYIVRAHYTFQVMWNGGEQPGDVSVLPILGADEVAAGATRQQIIKAHFGMGTVTVQNRWHYRTPAGINLLTISPPNEFIDGIAHMSGMIETDNLRRDFTFNLKITRPGTTIRIQKGTPIGCFIPYPRNFFDQFELRQADTVLPEDVIIEERESAGLAGLEREEIDARFRGGIGVRYMDGEDVFGNRFKDHQRMLHDPDEASRRFRVAFGIPDRQPVENEGQDQEKTAEGLLHLRRVIPPEVCKFLSEAWENQQAHVSDESDRNPFFDGRVLHYPEILQGNPLVAGYMRLVTDLVCQRLQAHFNIPEIWADDIQLVKWWTGHVMHPHADKENPDKSPHDTPWRDFASVGYLNDAYEGGEIEFPHLKVTLRPDVGDILCFRGDLKHLHGVRLVRAGVRYTMPTWYTNRREHRSPDVYPPEDVV